MICKGGMGFEGKTAIERKLCVGYFDPDPRKIRDVGKIFCTETKHKTEYFEYFVRSDSRQGRVGGSLSDEANVKKPKQVKQQNING